MYDLKIYKYVDANDFADFIEFEFGIDRDLVRDKLLDNDYLEGSLGSTCKLDDYIQSEVDKGNEIAKWYVAFLINYDLNEIQLKY